MKMKLAVAAIVCAALSIPAQAGESGREGPRAILPMHQGDKVVEFDHLRHDGVACVQCHHNIGTDLEQTFTPYKCSSCHGTDDKQQGDSYFQIIHGKTALEGDPASRCLACHTEVQEERAEDEPSLTSCTNSSCH